MAADLRMMDGLLRVRDDLLVERDRKSFGLPNAVAGLQRKACRVWVDDLRMLDVPAVPADLQTQAAHVLDARLARQNRPLRFRVCQILDAKHFSVRVEDNGRLFHQGWCADGTCLQSVCRVSTQLCQCNAMRS